MDTILGSDAPANIERTDSRRVRPICEFCGRRGRAMVPDDRGRVDPFDLARGWSVAPYPLDLVHADGSIGDLFTCPACDARLRRGAGLRSRAHIDAPQIAARLTTVTALDPHAVDRRTSAVTGSGRNAERPPVSERKRRPRA